MGITGLLPLLEKATKPCHISEFRGATVVIDTYCWLHKGATACAIQLIQGEETDVYVNYCMRYVKMLQSYDIRPVLVFDGKNLPAKSKTEIKRREARNKAKQRVAELLHLGKTEDARNYLKQAVNVTPQMALAVIKECQKNKVDCIVAPYESDAQLAFFNIKGIAEVVITEDSDLILFGCTKVLYKLDIRGCGYLVETEKIAEALNIRPDKFSFDKFRHMCILSGCDYADSLPGIGLKKAQKFITLTEETNPEIFLDRIPRYLNMRHLQITDEYKENFLMANATFQHQIIFDPFQKKLVPLRDPDVLGTNPKYCKCAGEIYDHDKAFEVALGNLHPSTFEKLNDWHPSQNIFQSNNSIWSGIYKKTVSRKLQKAQAKKSIMGLFISKSESITDTEELHLKTEEDMKLTKELQFYSQASLETQECKKTKILVEKQEIKKEHTSPVLTKNPFIKRLSKFPRAQSPSDVIVKSRYFFSATSKIKEDTNKEEILNENEDEIELRETEESVNKSGTSTDLEISNLEPSDDVVINNEIEKKSSEMNPAKNEANDTHFSPSKVSLFSNKKRKSISCRTVGLKRVKSEGQKTIHNFFKKS